MAEDFNEEQEEEDFNEKQEEEDFNKEQDFNEEEEEEAFDEPICNQPQRLPTYSLGLVTGGIRTGTKMRSFKVMSKK